MYRYFWFTAAEGQFYLSDSFQKKGVSVFLNVLGSYFVLFKNSSARGTVAATHFSYIAQSLWKRISIFVNWEELQKLEVITKS